MKKIFFLILLPISLNSFSQNIHVSRGIDTNIFKVSEPLNLWLDFLNTKDDSTGSKYWNKNEVEKYGNTSYFRIEKFMYFGRPNYLKLASNIDLKVLGIRKVGELFKITTSFEFPQKDTVNEIMYIFNVFAGYEEGKLKLYNAVNVNPTIQSKTVGYVKYHFPKNHIFNYKLAKKQNDFLVNFCKDFKVPMDTIDYYFASTEEELNRMRGVIYSYVNNGIEIPSGKADSDTRMVFCSGSGEYYPHEILHILIGPYYKNCHHWFNEGFATYFGMSRGKELNWHLERLNSYLLKHPEIDLNNMLKYRALDSYTSYQYVLGGYLIKKAHEKGGIELIKKMLNAGRTKEEFYNAIETHLGIKKTDLNGTIREDLKEMFK